MKIIGTALLLLLSTTAMSACSQASGRLTHARLNAEQSAWSSQVIAPEREQLAGVTAAVRALQDALSRRDRPRTYLLVQQTTDRLDQRGAGINAYWKANGMDACLDSPL